MTVPIAAAPRRPMRWLAPALWLILSVAIVVAARHVSWPQVLTLLLQVKLAWVAVAVAANFAILPLWAIEWRLLAPAAARVSFKGMWDVVTISAAVLNTVPFLAGEATAVALLVDRAGLTRGAALSVLALDQLLVAFAKLTVIGTAALAAPLPEWLRGGVLSLAIAFALLLGILMLLAHRWSSLRARLQETQGRARDLGARLLAWGQHFELLRNRPRIAQVMTLALAKKAAELAAIVAIQLAFGFAPSFNWGILILAALAITTLLPVAPGNLGVYEATVYGVYRYVGVQSDAALGMALAQHLCFLLPPIVVGYASLTARQLSRRSPASSP